MSFFLFVTPFAWNLGTNEFSEENSIDENVLSSLSDSEYKRRRFSEPTQTTAFRGKGLQANLAFPNRNIIWAPARYLGHWDIPLPALTTRSPTHVVNECG